MKAKCPFCGQNQVPHFLYWYNESVNILLTPLRQKLFYNSFSRWLKLKGFTEKMARAFFKIGKFFGIIKLRNDIAKCKVRRAQVLWEEASRRGIQMNELFLFGKPFDCYIAKKGNHEFLFSGLPRPARIANPVLDVMDDKRAFKNIMLKNGMPVPAGGSVTKFKQALEIFKKIRKPVIVKPRSGSRGRHSTTFVDNEQKLLSAFKIAKQLCHWVVVEEQLFGPVYRATVIDFKLRGVLRGDAPEVVGDGIATIEDLVKAKNQQPHPGAKDIIIDGQMELFLGRQGFSPSSVIPKGQIISLSEKIGASYGGSSSEDIEICHPDNKELFISAAGVLNDPIVGFDFITPDIARSYKNQLCGFIEANSLPFINLHHDPLHGPAQNVAAAVWAMVGL